MNKLTKVLLKKEKYSKPPIWIMRQAGRYLPEYREVRSKVDNFLELCYTPEVASKVTLQPIERFDFDAAIIFSDILTIPDALGLDVKFVKGVGPKIGRISEMSDLEKLKVDNIKDYLKPVFEVISVTRDRLTVSKDLIGFSGSPWTLACYMVEGGGSKNFDLARKAALLKEEFFSKLIDILTDSVINYLKEQIKAGANVVKLFDSWAGILPPRDVERWVIEPNKKIVLELKKEFPEVPVICFPRGIGFMYEEFVREVGPDGIALDQNVDRRWAREKLHDGMGVAIQGNLDNYLLAFGSKGEIKKEVLDILKIFGDGNFIFNLGHGILPETPIENVEFVIDLINKNSG